MFYPRDSLSTYRNEIAQIGRLSAEEKGNFVLVSVISLDPKLLGLNWIVRIIEKRN